METKKGILTRIKNSTFEGSNFVGNFSHVVGSYFGFNSYCGAKCEIINTKIGKYCSISSRVEIIYGKHPSNTWVSTHPCFYSTHPCTGFTVTSDNLFAEHSYIDDSNYFVEIGNDVWIGHGVRILEGIKIGDGAIIGTGAVVTSSIPPYSIYGGNPAKEIKKRFSQEQIEFLNKIQWWEKDEEWIRKNAHLFKNIQEMMNKYM